MQELGTNDAVLTLIAAAVGAMWVFFKSTDFFSRLQRKGYGNAVQAIEAAIQETYSGYVRDIKAGNADGKLTDSERNIAMNRTKRRAKELAKELGTDLLNHYANDAVMESVIEAILRRVKKTPVVKYVKQAAGILALCLVSAGMVGCASIGQGIEWNLPPVANEQEGGSVKYYQKVKVRNGAIAEASKQTFQVKFALDPVTGLPTLEAFANTDQDGITTPDTAKTLIGGVTDLISGLGALLSALPQKSPTEAAPTTDVNIGVNN